MSVITAAVPLAILLAAAIIIAGASISFPWLQGKSDQIVFQKDVYTMNNALEASIVYLDTAMTYSVYQACHDVLSNPPATEDEFLSKLEEHIAENINRYTEDSFRFIDKSVTLPRYKVMFVTGPALIAQADPQTSASISRENVEEKEKIVLEKMPVLTQIVPCHFFYQFYSEKNDELQNEIPIIISRVINNVKWPHKGVTGFISDADLTGSLSDTAALQADPDNGCKALFKLKTGKTIPAVQLEMEAEIRDKIEKLMPEKQGTYKVETILDKIQVLIEHVFVSSSAGQDGSDYVCDFDYIADVSAHVEITDSDNAYPVHTENGIETINHQAGVSYTISGPSDLPETGQGPPTDFDDAIKKASDQFDIDQPLIKAIIKQESEFKATAESGGGSRGLMQLTSIAIIDVTEETYKNRTTSSHRYCKNQKDFDFPSGYIVYSDVSGVNDPDSVYNPEKNIMVGTCLFANLKNQYENNELALAGYNAGTGRVLGWRKCIGNLTATWEDIIADTDKIIRIDDPDPKIDCHLPTETLKYVPSVLKHYANYQKY